MKKLALTAALLASPACAQTPSSPPCAGADYRAFDFWVGEWVVSDPQGVKQGDNSVTREEGGCLIVERWKAVSGNTGQSYNFYDPGSKAWRQVWVSHESVIDYAGGLNAKGEMVLEGEIRYRDGRKAPFKGIWTKQADGGLRQHFEEYDAAKKAWTDWFTGIYRRKS
jgi:hypothetical protein